MQTQNERSPVGIGEGNNFSQYFITGVVTNTVALFDPTIRFFGLISLGLEGQRALEFQLGCFPGARFDERLKIGERNSVQRLAKQRHWRFFPKGEPSRIH
jgi:hypothetical protein